MKVSDRYYYGGLFLTLLTFVLLFTLPAPIASGICATVCALLAVFLVCKAKAIKTAEKDEKHESRQEAFDALKTEISMLTKTQNDSLANYDKNAQDLLSKLSAMETVIKSAQIDGSKDAQNVCSKLAELSSAFETAQMGITKHASDNLSKLNAINELMGNMRTLLEQNSKDHLAKLDAINSNIVLIKEIDESLDVKKIDESLNGVYAKLVNIDSTLMDSKMVVEEINEVETKLEQNSKDRLEKLDAINSSIELIKKSVERLDGVHEKLVNIDSTLMDSKTAIDEINEDDTKKEIKRSLEKLTDSGDDIKEIYELLKKAEAQDSENYSNSSQNLNDIADDDLDKIDKLLDKLYEKLGE